MAPPKLPFVNQNFIPQQKTFISGILLSVNSNYSDIPLYSSCYKSHEKLQSNTEEVVHSAIWELYSISQANHKSMSFLHRLDDRSKKKLYKTRNVKIYQQNCYLSYSSVQVAKGIKNVIYYQHSAAFLLAIKYILGFFYFSLKAKQARYSIGCVCMS